MLATEPSIGSDLVPEMDLALDMIGTEDMTFILHGERRNEESRIDGSK